MKNTNALLSILAFSLLIIALISCEQNSSITETVKAYPENVEKVFDAHGGLATWKKMRSLSYDINKGGSIEKQTIDLQDRREVIIADNFHMGFDGSDTWIKADTSYKGNPMFYRNLMFYFYAMPFVLADDGIIYGEADPLEYDGTSYPGISISYESGVGLSSNDEYFLHYHPGTFEMEWLGYTVTYYSGEKSAKKSWIRYTDWDEFGGLLLPTELTWQKVEEGKIVGNRNARTFKNIKISEKVPDSSLFEMIPGAAVVTE